MKNKSVLFQLIAMICAMVLAVMLLSNINTLSKRLKDTVEASNQAHDRWESISDTKEILLEDVTQAISDLKEATLTIAEKEEKKISLSEDIRTLQEEIKALEEKLK